MPDVTRGEGGISFLCPMLLGRGLGVTRGPIEGFCGEDRAKVLNSRFH